MTSRGATVAVLGERIVDFVPVDRSSEGSTPDDLYRAVAGGSPANVALGVARLGGTPILLGRAGDDGMARLLDRAILDNGLSTAALLRRPGPSLLAVCTRQADGSVEYAFYHQGCPDLSWTTEDLEEALGAAKAEGAVAWHTGSLVSWLGPGVGAVLTAWEREREAGALVLSYDPNARPGTVAREDMRATVERFVAPAHVVKASDADLELLYPGERPEDVCARWAAAGPELVVLTRGPSGLSAWRTGRAEVSVPGVPVEVSDTVGAGDTVTAALLAGLGSVGALAPGGAIAAVGDADLAGILRRAATAAAITCSRAGANPPTVDEVDALLPEAGATPSPGT